MNVHGIYFTKCNSKRFMVWDNLQLRDGPLNIRPGQRTRKDFRTFWRQQVANTRAHGSHVSLPGNLPRQFQKQHKASVPSPLNQKLELLAFSNPLVFHNSLHFPDMINHEEITFTIHPRPIPSPHQKSKNWYTWFVKREKLLRKLWWRGTRDGGQGCVRRTWHGVPEVVNKGEIKNQTRASKDCIHARNVIYRSLRMVGDRYRRVWKWIYLQASEAYNIIFR